MKTESMLSLLAPMAATAAVGICITNRDGLILYLNEAASAFATPGASPLDKKEADVFGYPSVVEMAQGRHEVISFSKEMTGGHFLYVSAFPVEDHDQRISFYVIFLREQKKDIVDDGDTLLVTKSSSMAHVLSLAAKLARIDSTVLISGESGSGKVMLAQYIHRNSSRRNGAFASLNCAAMPGELLEMELFGNAGSNGELEKPGILTMAGKGTLFLDEIDALPGFIQTRLLYTLHERSYHPVGGRKGLPVECRIIVATDQDLHKLIAEGQFREDLYYLMGVFEVTIPPVRERTVDILPLIHFLVERYNRRYDLHRRITDDALDVLAQYAWPGNLREMDNTIERLVVTCPEDLIDVYHLPDRIRFQIVAEQSANTDKGSLDRAVADVERAIICRTYEEYGSSYEVARVLKISQSKASRLIRKYCGSKKKSQN